MVNYITINEKSYLRDLIEKLIKSEVSNGVGKNRVITRKRVYRNRNQKRYL